MKVVHSWLKEYVGEVLPDIAQVEELLTFHAFEVDGVEEVIGESVIDVDVLPNRASDCLSHRGIARELATILDVTLENDLLNVELNLPQTHKIDITVADTAACERFTAVVIEGVEVKDSPQWLKKRLEALGQRSINNIVDATNYVMFALGQPMHAYDADRFPQVDGQWRFGVRFSEPGETVSLLSESGKNEDRLVELDGSELLIVDGSSDTPVGLAGIKGGRHAELHQGTTRIILEAAHFNPAVIRKTARRLGILTDASKRFENNPSSELPLFAQQEIVRLIMEIAGGTVLGLVDVYGGKQGVATVYVTLEKTNALLGLDLNASAVQAIIERTGSVVEVVEAGVFSVTPPFERTDLVIEEDYIEEVGRIHGLSDITSVVPGKITITEVNQRQFFSETLRMRLTESGFSEVITSSFLKKGKIQLQNALASDKSYVRNTIKKNITAVLDANYAHCDLLGIDMVRVFEIGTVFDKTADGVGEHVVLTLGVRTKGDGYNPKDDKQLEAAIVVVETVLGTNLDWDIEKGVAELNLTAVLENLGTPSEYDEFVNKSNGTYKRPSAYPAMSRDIALWVAGDVQAGEVAGELMAAAGPLLVRHSLFDTFEKDGRTSYAFRLVFQSAEKTLTDEEVNKVMDEVNKISAQKNWEVR